MSASETIVPPQENLFVASDRGLTAWKAVFDRIIVDPLPAGMRSLKIMLAGAIVYERVLSAEEASHLANLLSVPGAPPQPSV